MESVAVQVELPVWLDDGDGGGISVQPTPRGAYEMIPLAIYRRHRWQGIFRRSLVRVRGFGREYFEDGIARAVLEQETSIPPAGVPVAPPTPTRRGCGCGPAK